MWTYVLFVLGFVLLIGGANALVEGASAVARRLMLSELVIGLTIVAFGTSLPELVVSVVAASRGDTGLAIGNVLGSNIFNTLIILGIAALLQPLHLLRSTRLIEIPFSLLAVAAVAALSNDKLLGGAAHDGLTRGDGLVLLLFFLIFMAYTANQSAQEAPAETELAMPNLWLAGLRIGLGLVGLVLGGRWIVDGAVELATLMGISETVIGLTVVAAGTSLPELATSAVAARRGYADLAVGNVVGSNLFNIFFILGVGASLHPLPFQSGSNVDLGVIFLSGLLLLGMGAWGRISRGAGLVLLLLYGGYLAYLLLHLV
ncbi:cation:H+ antiporter [Catalinimonas alkaloidigena]|uniref:Cation:H+ antiporter n=1 Tax=Catalinimonas alkaloidigena TaxID=1075417 RepID=A0A1G8Y4F5_9BACT|nr:calcium/sodium antiporter [Catalinimonas alkaloidigena]SDJ97676.1 cation:H+ antiporter [Catalinimonas alkaloidigena]